MNDLKWDYNNGDVAVVSDKDDIAQAILNRLNTDTDELDYLYDDYGCNLRQYLGLPATDTTLEMVKNTISDTLSRDERLTLLDLTLSYKTGGVINILVRCSFNDEDIEMNLNLTDDGVVMEDE